MGAQLESDSVAHLHSSLKSFRSSLEKFAFEHRTEIASNPLFRAQFHRMCASTGVDPLDTRGGNGFWAALLNLGDFYAELSVRVVNLCRETRKENGGLIRLEEVRRALEKKNTQTQNVITLYVATSGAPQSAREGVTACGRVALAMR
jgi:ESCRT-II complex subunit VPS22